jgi:hypothetical protein
MEKSFTACYFERSIYERLRRPFTILMLRLLAEIVSPPAAVAQSPIYKLFSPRSYQHWQVYIGLKA